MRGYHRPRADLQPLVTPSKSREQIAADIAAGHPSPVAYEAHRPVVEHICPGVTSTTFEPAELPVHLRRAPEKQS